MRLATSGANAAGCWAGTSQEERNRVLALPWGELDTPAATAGETGEPEPYLDFHGQDDPVKARTYHALDIAAGAVLVASVFAAAVGLIVFGRRIWMCFNS